MFVSRCKRWRHGSRLLWQCKASVISLISITFNDTTFSNIYKYVSIVLVKVLIQMYGCIAVKIMNQQTTILQLEDKVFMKIRLWNMKEMGKTYTVYNITYIIYITMHKSRKHVWNTGREKAIVKRERERWKCYMYSKWWQWRWMIMITMTMRKTISLYTCTLFLFSDRFTKMP